MPVVGGPLDHAGRAVVELYVAMTGAEAGRRRLAGLPVAPPCRVRAQVDTGASDTYVMESVLTRLGVSPVDERPVRVHSATTGGEPVTARLYAVDLDLAGEVTGRFWTALAVVAARDLRALGVEALLGRDVLGKCVLLFNGVEGYFELAYPPLATP